MRNLDNPSAVIHETSSARELFDFARMAFGRAAGEVLQGGKALLKAKGLIDHGEWLKQLRRIHVHPRAAQRAMKAAAEAPHRTVNAALLSELLDSGPVISDSLSHLTTPESNATPSQKPLFADEIHRSPDIPSPPPDPPPAPNPPVQAEDELCFSCARRKRVGQELPASCKDCRERRVLARQGEPAPWEADSAPAAPDAAGGVLGPSRGDADEGLDVRPVDPEGTVIPDRVRGHLNSTAIADQCQRLMDFSDGLVGLVGEPGGAFVAEVLETVQASLELCRDKLMAKRPVYVCPAPDCRGLSERCALCRSTGAVPRDRFQ